MNKQLLALLASASLVLPLSACMQQRAADLPEGTYKSDVSTTDANGTTYETKKTTDVDVDQYGNRKTVVKAKTTKDPKGLFNKTTTSKSKEVIKDEEYNGY